MLVVQSYPTPGDLPDPGIEPGSPALQAVSLPSEPPGKSRLLNSFSVRDLTLGNSDFIFNILDPFNVFSRKNSFDKRQGN